MGTAVAINTEHNQGQFGPVNGDECHALLAV